MTCAYRQYYLEDAMGVLGAAVEAAVMLFEIPLARFWSLFLASPHSQRFATGDPLTLTGQSGWELAERVLTEAGVEFQRRVPDGLRARTPEYWAGWALAQYQWYRGFSFVEIEEFAPMTEVVRLYSPYHEMSILAFHEEMDRRYRLRHPTTRLQELRKAAGLTRDDLAALAQVSSRLIEQYEQRRRNINAARADTVLSLAQSLNCEPRMLLERVAATPTSR